ncbi:radical SAM protein [Sulfurimonas sp. HSL-1716]|uniref:radical SAM protein n=1 Tax=Hydrocurvibacter sulfurireducens TaxID=3131937 RepID=UPI0031F7A2F8
MENKTVFGPIHSRRFGSSLGVDLSPAFKQCNFDCLYCELTPAATIDKQTDVVSVQTIIKDLSIALEEHRNIDVITLTANGEPTLYPYLDELVDEIKRIKGAKEILILTNSAALINEKIFHTLLKLDQVKLSLDAVTLETFKKIDRPHEGIDIDTLISRVQEFSRCFKGKLFIEVLFVHGLNDTKEEVEALNEVLKTLEHIQRIDLGTIDRPPAYPVQGISYGELFEIARIFDASLPVHIASRTHAESCIGSYGNDEIINMLDKRPLTFEDIELLFDKDSKTRLEKLIKNGEITVKKVGNLEFLIPLGNLKRKRQKS